MTSGSDEETIKLWGFHTGSLRHTLENHAEEGRNEIACVVFSLDGQILYSGSAGASSYYWDVSGGRDPTIKV